MVKMKYYKVLLIVPFLFYLITAFIFASGTVSEDKEEKVKIVWQCMEVNTAVPPPMPNNYVERLLEERFDCEIETLQISRSESARLQAYIAEGNMPDKLWYIPGTTLDYLIEQGLLRSVEPEWFSEYMPNRMKLLEEMYGLSTAELVERHEYQGKWYGMQKIQNFKRPNFILVMRQDYADNVGFTKKLVTTDDFFELAKKLTYDDPDKNGRDDTYAIGGRGDLPTFGFNYLLGAYGIMQQTWFVRDGKVICAEATSEFKEVTKIVKEWYSAGVIDPEMLTDSGSDQLTKWYRGLLGTIYTGGFGFMDAYADYKQPVLDNFPDARFTPVDALIGPTGKAAYPTGPKAIIGYGSIGFEPVFGYKASDDVVKKIMEIYDAVLADEDLYIATSLGVEGTHWKYVDGTRTPLPGYGYGEAKGQEEGLLSYFDVSYAPFEWWTRRLTKFDLDLLDWWDRQPKICRLICVDQGDKPTYSERYKNIVGDYRTVTAEYFSKIMVGQIDAEEGWDDYLTKLKAIGLFEYNNELQKNYDEAQAARSN